jgi:hypothetical protein
MLLPLVQSGHKQALPGSLISRETQLSYISAPSWSHFARCLLWEGLKQGFMAPYREITTPMTNNNMLTAVYRLERCMRTLTCYCMALTLRTLCKCHLISFYSEKWFIHAPVVMYLGVLRTSYYPLPRNTLETGNIHCKLYTFYTCFRCLIHSGFACDRPWCFYFPLYRYHQK